MPQSVNKLLLLLLHLFLFQNNVYANSYSKDSVDYYIKEAKIYSYTDFKRAENCLNKAAKIADQLKDKNLIAEVIFNRAANHYIIGSYDVALKNFLEASELFESKNNQLGIAKCLMGKGIILQGIGRDKEAIENFTKSIAICRKIKNDKFTTKNLLNLGVSYINLKNYNEAYKKFSESLKISKKNAQIDDYHMGLNKLGQVHFFKKNLDSALYYYKKVIDDSDKPNLWEVSFAVSGIAETYLEKGNYPEAINYGLNGYQSAVKVQAKWDIARAAEIVSRIYRKQNDFKNAYNYLEIHKIYNDSLYADSKIKHINIMQLEAKEAENQKLSAKAEIAQQKLNNTRIFVGFIFFLLISLLIFIYQYSKYTTQKEKLYKQIDAKNKEIESQQSMIISQNSALEELNQTKNKLFSVLSHDLKSPMNSLLQVIELNKDEDLTKEEQAVIYEHLHKQVEGTSLMLNNILSWASSQIDGAKVKLEKVELNQIIDETVNSLYRDAFKKKISFLHDKKDIHFVNADIGQARIILQNILANALKYAPLNSKIEIFYSEENKYQNVHIRDFGDGINQNKIQEIISFDKRLSSEKGTSMEEGTGLGLLLVKQFLLNNKGKLNIKSTEGKMTEFVISFLKHHS